ncbi:MAG: carbon monoxide dehydrogenase subunit G [Nitrospinae bacterium]|nr:carbon monoxide dehydrogenase subunit G [Nitrospinota bacterium]
MKVSGTYLLKASRERVWQLLTDPACLKACLPGCESLEASGPDQYQAVLTVGIAAVKGKYTGTVILSEKQPPRHFTLQVEGKGSPGFMKGIGVLELAEEADGTKVMYQGDVQVGGPIAGVGQRLLDGVSKMLVGQFFTAASAQLEAMASPPTPNPRGSAEGVAPSTLLLTTAPVQISPWRTLLRFLWTQGKERLRHWFTRSA